MGCSFSASSPSKRVSSASKDGAKDDDHKLQRRYSSAKAVTSLNQLNQTLKKLTDDPDFVKLPSPPMSTFQSLDDHGALPAIPDELVNQPQVIFEYEFHQMMGKGSHARVYHVYDTERNEDFAAKVYDKSLFSKSKATGKKLFDLMMNEIKIMSELHDPNCVELFEVLEDDFTNSIILIITYADKGGIITSSDKAKPIDEAVARDVSSKIAKAIEYIHNKNIIHRDIKPENILICSDGRSLLADFSASKMLDSEVTLLDDTIGTPVYYSPEECAGKPYKGKPTDIWAFGVSIYVMLYGKLPFWEDENSESADLSQFYHVSQDIITQPVDYENSDDILISDSVVDLMKHMLVKDPEKRYKIEDVLNHPWITGEHFSSAISEYSD